MKQAFLFPGQGAQTVGMGKDLYDKYQVVRDLFSLCEAITKKDVTNLLFNSDEEVLQQTDNTQIAMTLVSLSVASVMREKDIIPDIVAGFSLGEYAALVLAGIITNEQVFQLVVERGAIMDEASKSLELRYEQEGKVGMTAVLGLDPNYIQELLDKWSIPNVYLAMYNSPIQGVLAGTEKAREEVAEKLSAEGARRIIPLKVSGPFHTPLMQEAKEKYREVLSGIEFKDPSITILSNVHGNIVETGEEMKQLCADQLVNPVRWMDEEDGVFAQNPSNVYEVGIGNVLSGLWKAWKKSKEEENIPDCNVTGSVDNIEKIEG